MPKTVFIIAGPTAVGKTGIAVDLAKRLGTAIISADSRQCCHGMRIGTAQPALEELAAVKHYFIDAFPVTENISAARYERLALGYLDDVFITHDTAVVCGGTGLYIRALCEGLDEMPEVSPDILAEIEKEFAVSGIAYLQSAIEKEDPAFFAQGEIQNPARLVRALSFVRTTAQSILSYRKSEKKIRPFRMIKIGLELPRDVLYQRINARVDEMMTAGLLDEVKSLLPFRGLKNLQTVGYSELFEYLDGKLSLNDAVNLIRQHSRHYAKRQLTWFKKYGDMEWLAADETELAARICRHL